MAETEWMPISEAIRQFNISYHVIKRLVKEERLNSKHDIIDRRKVLVDAQQLRQILSGEVSHENDN